MRGRNTKRACFSSTSSTNKKRSLLTSWVSWHKKSPQVRQSAWKITMKFSSTALLLLVASASSLQTPNVRKAIAGASVVASAMLPLAAPAFAQDVKADIQPLAAAKSIFDHRSQLQQAAVDFVSSVQKLGNDLDGVLPPAPDVTVIPPQDVKQAIKDALVGQGRLIVNGQPLYVEVDAKEGFYTFKIISPLLPKLPFLEPTPEQRASMVIPRATVVQTTPVAQFQEAVPAGGKPFWEWSFKLPGANQDINIVEAAAGVVAGAYITTYGYYVASNALEEQQAKAKQEANKAKAAQRKAAAETAAKADTATEQS
jgi:hypothetical protein